MAKKHVADVPEDLEDAQTMEAAAAFAGNPPVLDDLPVRNYHPGRELVFYAYAFDLDWDAVTYAKVNGPGTVDANTGRFSWTPALTQTGSVVVTIRATAGGDSVQRSTTLNRLNVSPLMQDLPTGWHAHPGRALSFYVNACDFDPDDTVTYSLQSGPGAIDASGKYTWNVPSSATGSQTIRIRATDSCGDFTEKQCNITVANQAPFIDFIPTRMAKVVHLLSFFVNVFDPDCDTVTFSLGSGNPAGSQIDPNTGQFSWTPANGQQGQHTITVIATDPCSGMPGTFSRQFMVNVAP